MTQEEKAKLYDELKVKAQELAEDGYIDKLALVDMFPELKESEDERNRKYILSHLQGHLDTVREFTSKGISSPFSAEEIKMLEASVAWLESQGEQKPAWSEEDEKHIMAIDLAVNRCDGKWNCCGEKCPISEHSPWLKSLKGRAKPQSTWKPSDMELEVLRLAAEKDGTCLMGLYEQLKKLKEE